MATPALPPPDYASLSRKEDDDDTIFTFSRGLRFTIQLVLGIFALGGCLVVQCLLVAWFALMTAQVKSMHLQARMFEYAYGKTIEKAQLEHKKKKNVIRIEIAPSQGTNAQKAQIIKKDLSFDETISLNIRTFATEIVPPVKDSAPLVPEVAPPTPKSPLSGYHPLPHEVQPLQLKPQAAEAATTGVSLPTPVTLPVRNPNWQTKFVQEREAGSGRAYAVKQVDVFAPGNDEPHAPFLAPPPADDRRFKILEPASMQSATRERFGNFLGHAPATTAAAPFEAADSSRKTIPPFLTPYHTKQSPVPGPRPVVKLPDMSSSSGSKPNAPKGQLDLQLPAFGNEQHPVNSAPKKVRRSMVRLVQPETLLQTPPDLPKPQPRPRLDEKPKVEEPPKPVAPIETPKIKSTEPTQPAVTASQPKISQNTSKIASPGAEPDTFTNAEPANCEIEVEEPPKSTSPTEMSRINSMELFQPAATATHFKDFLNTSNISSVRAETIPTDVEPLKIDQLRHRFIETSVLKASPAPKPQLELLPAIQPISPEVMSRDALVIAFHERESARVKLSRNYSQACVERFTEKAQEYKARRKALASLMPSGNLSFEDGASFPHLATKNTEEPVVPSPTGRESQRPYPLPSPPTSCEEDNEQHILREDPGPLLSKASRAYQVLLQATKNMEEECLDCNSKFCLNSYSPAGQRKMKSAKELYQKSRSRLGDAYESRQLPASLTNQYPELGGC